ncbi:hypothetical protein V6N12_057658 [Hibiscus sabdariffa]|uniref:Uncharacterized protein n=1 Tax=Hibiscus sabdariffa TaxID=183260 RepID=A0ABR2C5R7_9ROSI
MYSFVARIFGHALEDSHSNSGLVNSLSVCISLLDPKRSAISSPLMHSFRNHLMYEPPIPINSETINAMLPKLGDLLMLLNVSSDEKILPTTHGELRPPLGKHRLRVHLSMKHGRDDLGRRRRMWLLQTPPTPTAAAAEAMVSEIRETLTAAAVAADEAMIVGVIAVLLRTGKRISNKLVQLGSSNSHIQACLQIYQPPPAPAPPPPPPVPPAPSAPQPPVPPTLSASHPPDIIVLPVDEIPSDESDSEIMFCSTKDVTEVGEAEVVLPPAEVGEAPAEVGEASAEVQNEEDGRC